MWLKLDFLYNLFSHKDDTADKERELHKVLEIAQTKRQEYDDENYIEKKVEDLDEATNETCTQSLGKITSLNNEAGMINREIPFPLHLAPSLHLNEGQTVSYLWYKKDDDVKIVRIVAIVEENWNEPVTDEAIEEVRLQRPEVFATRLVTKFGFICQKQKDMIVVDGEDEKFSFSLDDVESTFTPRKYDQISFVCKVQQDPKLINESGITVEVQKIEPNINKRVSGKITLLQQNQHGIIAEKYFFYWDALASDYRIVSKGDQVTADCIQCERVDESVYEWRCLKVVLVESAAQQVQEIQESQLLMLPKMKEAQNKNGIEITDDVVVEFNEIKQTKEFTMMVKNTAEVVQKVLESVFIGNKSESQLKLISPGRSESFFLQSGEEREYKFQARSRLFGDSMEKFYVKFSGPAGRFKILRNITVSVHDTEHLNPNMGTGSNLHKNLSYTQRVFRRDVTRTVPGIPLQKSANFVKTRFQQWHVPEKFKAVVLDPKCTRDFISETLDTIMPFLKENLNMKNYSTVFHHLLYLEECEMFHNMRKYDKKSFFKREKEYLALPVQNIAESRPSLVVGDYVIATSLFASQTQPANNDGYQGFIHLVKHDRVLLKFNEGFHAKYNSEDYDIVFYFSRTPLRKQHHAVDLVARNLPFVLFPNRIMLSEKQVDVSLNTENGELRFDDSIVPWYNPSLNIIQKQAVTNILQGVARPMPYVIFGPPGTGKTMTLIETILQLYKKIPHSRILVATPSNSSANLITERIIESGVLMQGEFLRLVSENSIQKESIPENIISHCGTVDIAREGTTDEGVKLTESGLKMNCNAKYLKLRRVLIGTCITLGTLMQCDFPEGHFTHIIVDESGQCLETEVMIPISFVDKKCGQIILAGDPMQLGPIVLSHYADNRGLEQSYLVRLLDRSPYKPDPERFEHRYDPRLVTRLVFNYRSLPTIMNVYSDLFYDKDLKAMVNDVDSEEAEILKQLHPILPNENTRAVTQGLIFVGVEGRSQQSAESPSWLNKAEANNVLQFLMKLIVKGFSADDIGIITPYTQQAKTIRMLIESTDLVMPKIGTVEEFQGQERKIILLSTVRTLGREMRNADRKYSLGFVKSPKRMNVAISRARALLVIFGSPQLLVRDDNWKFLIENCINNNSAINCDPAILNKKNDSDDDEDDDDDDNN